MRLLPNLSPPGGAEGIPSGQICAVERSGLRARPPACMKSTPVRGLAIRVKLANLTAMTPILRPARGCSAIEGRPLPTPRVWLGPEQGGAPETIRIENMMRSAHILRPGRPLAAASSVAATMWAVVAAFSLLVEGSVRAENRIPDEYRVGGFAIGCITYTFNQYSAFEAIEKSVAAGGLAIEISPGQILSAEDPNVKVDISASDEVIAKVKAKLKQHHATAVSIGVVGLPNNEAECRKVFEFARKMGLATINAEPAEDALDLVERLIKEYDIKVAIHNHPRNPDGPAYRYWDPSYILSLVKDRDPRLGACADTGHWIRSGIKPVDALKILKGRIISVHLKDLNVFSRGGHDVPFGTGVADIAAILDELRSQGFEGTIAIEYEYNWTSSVPEVAQCIGFIRGYGAAKK